MDSSMSISNCTLRLAKWKNQKVFYREGHVQIWRELTEDEYMVSCAARFRLSNLELSSNPIRENLPSIHQEGKYQT
jgi:hypothetical protein